MYNFLSLYNEFYIVVYIIFIVQIPSGDMILKEKKVSLPGTILYPCIIAEVLNNKKGSLWVLGFCAAMLVLIAIPKFPYSCILVVIAAV